MSRAATKKAIKPATKKVVWDEKTRYQNIYMRRRRCHERGDTAGYAAADAELRSAFPKMKQRKAPKPSGKKKPAAKKKKAKR